jgi:heat shock protein HslJ
MTCPDRIMDLESNYLEALENVSRYRFLAGKLALTWQKNDTVNIMLFVSSETQEEF